MIPFSFSYVQPKTLKEARETYCQSKSIGEKPMYYAGGTEIITMGRVNSLRFDMVIDIKGIPDMQGLKTQGSRLVIGAAETLNEVICWNAFPLLSKCCKRVASHTAQCKITLGGNVAGTVIYHETALALLLADAQVSLYGEKGVRKAPIRQLFDPDISLLPGEMIVSFSIDKKIASLPYVHVKHVDSEKIGYPLFTLAAIRKKDTVEVAASGLYRYPIRLSFSVREAGTDPDAWWEAAEQGLPGLPMGDALGSGEYRQFKFREALENTRQRLAVEAA